MTITHKLKLDLQHKGEMQRIDVVQGDAFTRQVDLVLENGGKPWLFPICDPVARYCKPDGTVGVYDTLPTGAPAFSYAGNMLTLVLAPQMLTCPGVVQVQVEMSAQDLKLATFTFLVVVEPGVALYGESEDYVNWIKAFLPQTTGAKVGQYLQISKVDDVGRIIEMAPVENPAGEATNKAYEALRIANDVAQEIKAYSPSGTRSIAEAAMRTASSRLVAPKSASVGQYVRVKEVDANGVVTAVEAVDVTSGGNVDQVVLTSPDGSKWNLTVGNSGNVVAVKVSGGDEPEVVTYTVTSGLTNVESTNLSAVVNEGESYTAILTSAEGYGLDTVTVTMGGVDITATAYANGVVTIASVMGNVVITAIAVETADIDYHVMTLEDASETMTAQGKTLIRGYDNSEHSNVLVPNNLNELPVWISTSYPGTNNFNVSDNIENLSFEENSTVTGNLEILGNSLKTIKNVPAGMTSLSTGHKPPYAPNLESVGGLENNTVLTSLNMGQNTALKYPPVLNANAPITSLNTAFANCKGMDYDISSWRIPSKVTNIKQLFRSCGGITGNFLVDRNYTADNCLFALYETGVREVTVTDANFAAPFHLFEEGLKNYTPLNSEDALNSTKMWKFHVPRDSAAYRVFRDAYAGMVNGIMKYELAVTGGNAPTKNITFYGDSQTSPFGNVTGQMLDWMSDDVFLWNLAVRGASTESYKPMFAKFPERRSDVTVLWLMTNDTGIGAEETMNNIKHYIDSLNTDKYVILGTWFFHYEELKARNEQLRATYGDHYFDVHQYTLDNWEQITGITPTEADLAAVANDTVPPSLIDSDGVHENDAGGLVIATGIREKLMELGYIDESWLAAE